MHTVHQCTSLFIMFISQSIERTGQEQGRKVLTPFRCAGLATFSFFVT